MTRRLHLARGFSFAGLHAGIKLQRPDLALIASAPPAAAAALVTQNRVRAACVDRTARLLPSSQVRAIVVGSGNANCRSGPDEAAHDERLAVALAEALDVPTEQVLTATTGSIGQPFPITAVEEAAPALVAALGDAIQPAAQAILTTDRIIKVASRQLDLPGGRVRLTALAKGSGMVHPDMATMLAWICTDAVAEPDELQALLAEAVAGSFNQISVDRDTSTNDMAMLLANGRSGVTIDRHCEPFSQAVQEICVQLARAIAADGEGATRLIQVEVVGSSSTEHARKLARSVVESNLFKCSLFGDGVGWGRALAAVGARAAVLGLELEPERVDLVVNGVELVRGGHHTGAAVTVPGPEVQYRLTVGDGEHSGLAWGCDLAYDYVSINAVNKADPLETHSPGLKRRLLVEALSYIRRFTGRLAVIKYGGAAMLRDDLKDAFAEDLVLLRAVGLQPVVVHGGGPEISRTLERLGEQPRFIDGVRVTDPSAMKIVEMVLSGSVNTDIVTRIHKQGGDAVGLSGKDGGLLSARKLASDGPDLGMVGQITSVRTDVLTMLLDKGYLPVISPVGVDEHGTTWNINADMVAAEVAVALGAEKLLFLTDVPGILRDGDRVSQVGIAELQALLDEGVVGGGMMPKVKALLDAVERGVTSGHVIDGRVPHNLLAELFTERGVGTWVRRAL